MPLPASKNGEAPGDSGPVMGTVEVTATGRRRRKDQGAARDAGKPWSDNEECLFLEALNLYGKASGHLGVLCCP